MKNHMLASIERRMPPSPREVMATLLLGVSLLGACSAPSETPSSGKSDPASRTEGRTVGAEVIDTAFRPTRLEIDAGTTVRWAPTGKQPHSVTEAEGLFDSNPECKAISSGRCLGEGDEFSYRFEKTGTYTYYCRVHGLPDGTGMVATIIVR